MVWFNSLILHRKNKNASPTIMTVPVMTPVFCNMWSPDIYLKYDMPYHAVSRISIVIFSFHLSMISITKNPVEHRTHLHPAMEAFQELALPIPTKMPRWPTQRTTVEFFRCEIVAQKNRKWKLWMLRLRSKKNVKNHGGYTIVARRNPP